MALQKIEQIPQVTDFFNQVKSKKTKKEINACFRKIQEDFDEINRLADEEEAQIKKTSNNPGDTRYSSQSPRQS